MFYTLAKKQPKKGDIILIKAKEAGIIDDIKYCICDVVETSPFTFKNPYNGCVIGEEGVEGWVSMADLDRKEIKDRIHADKYEFKPDCCFACAYYNLEYNRCDYGVRIVNDDDCNYDTERLIKNSPLRVSCKNFGSNRTITDAKTACLWIKSHIMEIFGAMWLSHSTYESFLEDYDDLKEKIDD